MKHCIMGAGDVGRRIARQLLNSNVASEDIIAFVKESVSESEALGLTPIRIDLDGELPDLSRCQGTEFYYTVAPQKSGVNDLRTHALIQSLLAQNVQPQKVVVLSTTGVYGDQSGDWVTEHTPTQAVTDRGKRRLDSEQQWLAWGQSNQVPIVILRVPGIYAFSRLPRERIAKGTPVVKPEECGFTNRIHADDLAHVAIVAMQRSKAFEVFNVTDGTPGKISEYLQAAAELLGYKALPEIGMDEAERVLSAGMLSYLSESRKISNQKMLDDLGVSLEYPDFRLGMRV